MHPMNGRVLHEALIGGPDEEQIAVDTRVLTTETRGSHYQAAIQNLGRGTPALHR